MNKVTKLVIKNMFGITEKELDGRSVELVGTNGTGKSSVIEALRLGLTNQSKRGLKVKKGATEGEIIIETNSGLHIDRKWRIGQADYKNIRENNKPVQSPEAYLSSLFSTLQLDPVEFTKMTRQEQNRAILDLIEFDWDMDFIKEKFGEIPTNVNYDQHILKVLDDIQSEKGDYYQNRQDINRTVRQNEEFMSRIAKSLPEGYKPDYWKAYDFNARYQELTQKKERNATIARAKVFAEGYNAKLESLQAAREKDIEFEKNMIAEDRSSLELKIERLKKEIALAEQQLSTLDDRLDDRIAAINSKYEAGKAKLDKDNAVAAEWANKEVEDVTALEAEVENATEMIKHLTESDRLKAMQAEQDGLRAESDELTRKIELARELPAEILKEATIPVEGLTVVNGEPLIDRGNGPLPINSLSEGEQLDLCVDVALSKSTNLALILIDGVERLSKANRDRLYAKCKEHGLQFIATRTTDSEELEVIYL